MLQKELDADDDEMTRTRKVRRSVVEKRYPVVEALHGQEDTLEVYSDIKYRDGKAFRMKTSPHQKVPEARFRLLTDDVSIPHDRWLLLLT